MKIQIIIVLLLILSGQLFAMDEEFLSFSSDEMELDLSKPEYSLKFVMRGQCYEIPVVQDEDSYGIESYSQEVRSKCSDLELRNLQSCIVTLQAHKSDINRHWREHEGGNADSLFDITMGKLTAVPSMLLGDAYFIAATEFAFVIKNSDGYMLKPTGVAGWNISGLAEAYNPQELLVGTHEGNVFLYSLAEQQVYWCGTVPGPICQITHDNNKIGVLYNHPGKQDWIRGGLYAALAGICENQTDGQGRRKLTVTRFKTIGLDTHKRIRGLREIAFVDGYFETTCEDDLCVLWEASINKDTEQIDVRPTQ